MRKILLIFVQLAFGSLSHSVVAQHDLSENDRKTDWWGDLRGFWNQQHDVTLRLASEALEKYKPALPEPAERRMALLMIDGVLHEEQAASNSSVQQFLQARIEIAAEDIERTRIISGARVWQLYNHGFVVRTASVTLGFDLVRGFSRRNKDFGVDGELIKRIADQCDVLFISHRHGDHADSVVAKLFIDRGKPVLAPPEVWEDRAIHKNITHLRREAHTLQAVDIRNASVQLRVANYPGHQGSKPDDPEVNVVVVFTPDNLSFAHTGDQSSNESDWSWIDGVHKHHQVDILMPNCWSPNILRMIKGFNPALVIPGHHNEMGHTIDHREPYWLTYGRQNDSTSPYVLLTWGESYHYKN